MKTLNELSVEIAEIVHSVDPNIKVQKVILEICPANDKNEGPLKLTYFGVKIDKNKFTIIHDGDVVREVNSINETFDGKRTVLDILNFQ